MKNSKHSPHAYKRLAAAALTSALLLTPLASLAESAVITGGSVNLRDNPSLSANILGSYPKGTWVDVVEPGVDWHKITVKDQSGYMSAKFLSTGTNSSSGKLTVNTNGRGLNLRSQPSDSSEILGSYAKGTKVTLVARGNTWHKVSVDGKTGYMYAKYLSGGSGSGSGGGSETSGNYGVVNNPKSWQVLFLRESNSTSSAVLGQYKNGKSVKILSTVGSWYKVSVDGKTGYMMSKYVKANSSSSSSTAKLYNPNGNSIVNFRKGASLSSKVIGTYKVGTKVTVLKKGTDWTRVKIDDTTGYVSTWFLKF